MNLHIWNPPTLKSFTDSIRSGFLDADIRSIDGEPADTVLIQIHGAPAARNEDRKIVQDARSLKVPKAFLIHRPDEALLDPLVRNYFESVPEAKLIFLGDLIFQDPFWANRRIFSSVSPHPQFDFSAPSAARKPILGSYTSWGEMRDVHHYFSLVENLKETSAFEFRIGGSGLEKIEIPEHIQYSKTPFTPHFNVQLYHLLGKKDMVRVRVRYIVEFQFQSFLRQTVPSA